MLHEYGSKLSKNRVYFAHIFGGALSLITFRCPNVSCFSFIFFVILDILEGVSIPQMPLRCLKRQMPLTVKTYYTNKLDQR